MPEADVQYLRAIIVPLIDKPEEMKITRTVDELGVLLTLDLANEDMGKVIGRAGNTAKAIRMLMRIAGMRNNARVNLKINEPVGSTYVPAPARIHEMQTAAPAEKTLDEALADL